MIANGEYGAYGVPVQDLVEKEPNKEVVVLFKILLMVGKNVRVVIQKREIAIRNNVKIRVKIYCVTETELVPEI